MTTVLCSTCNARCGYVFSKLDTGQDAWLCCWCNRLEYTPTQTDTGGRKSLQADA